MTRLRRLGLRPRLAAAVAGVALVAVALTTMLANAGLNSRLRDAAEARLATSARHSARLAAGIYARDGGWTGVGRAELQHISQVNGYRLTLRGEAGRAPARAKLPGDHAQAAVRVLGRTVGSVEISPLSGSVLTTEDRDLQRRLNRQHRLAALLALGIGVCAAMLLGPWLARPLRRLTLVAREMERGDLGARVRTGGGQEMEQVGSALNRLADTLEKEERARREAAADVAHELRTPLGGIISRIEAAQDGVLDERANLAAMHTDALRLARLVEDLGRLADAQRPGLLLERHVVDLAEIARQRAASFAGFFRARNVGFTEDLSPAPIRGDAARLGQIVDNLLSNALRYTDEGGHVALSVRRIGDGVELEVADDGIGIPGEDLLHVFERFWRGEKSRSRATGGAGIGLAIVRDLVRAHDGRIDVESSPGAGSRFRVRMPSALNPDR